MDPLGAITTSIELAVLVKGTFDQVGQNKSDAQRLAEEIVDSLELMENLVKANCAVLDMPELRASSAEFESELRIVLAHCLRKNKKRKGFDKLKSKVHDFFHADDIKEELSSLERKIDKCYRRLQMAVSARIERRVAESNIRIENPVSLLERHSEATNALIKSLAEEQKKNFVRLEERFESRLQEALPLVRGYSEDAALEVSSPDPAPEAIKKMDIQVPNLPSAGAGRVDAFETTLDNNTLGGSALDEPKDMKNITGTEINKAGLGMSDTKRAETHVRNPNEVSRTTKRNTREPGSNLSKEKSSDVIPASHIKNGRLQSGASSPKSSSLASFAPQAFEPGPAHRNHLISVPLSPHRTELMKKSSVHTPLIVDMATVLSGSKILSNNQDTRRPESEVKPNHLSRPT